jgi:uncharacterized protein (DUF58 family)
MVTDQQVEEMMSRVRKLEIKARRLVSESFSGEYQSSFKGQGLDFDDFREYQHGDEIRFIDWNVTARMNTPYIRKFREERELNVILAVDISGSSNFGSVKYSKREVAAETAAILGFSALQNGDKCGLLLFAADSILFIPPAKGTRHLLRLIREILITQPRQEGTSIEAASKTLIQVLPTKSLVFLLSDFLIDSLEKPLGKIAAKHDLIAIRILDPLEHKLPNAGRVTLRDPETGWKTLVNTSNSNLRMGYEKLMRRQREVVNTCCKKYGIDLADLRTDSDPIPVLHSLLKRRTRRRLQK